MSARVWITRTRPGADRTAERLRVLGLTPVVTPLLAVQPLKPALPDLDLYAALVFTSPNGVAAYAALTPRRDHPVIAVGDATVAAARDAGFLQARSAEGDIHALARLIADQPPAGPILAALAESPVADLAALTCARNSDVVIDALPIYRTVPTQLSAPPPAEAVLVHSPRAARLLAAYGRAALDACLVACISPQAAAPLDALDLKPAVADAPNDPALLATLQEALGKRERPV
ncbi:uroporphyrinogen-III synthase [Brevundimonas sp. SORGH_AS_0993]|uniref:uroporphyrinogen-III synthase n=1 Tax=Brevundimonas sp. SORGH_AS_0993 TaxID=3041794 RepID=UPI00278B2166|nr:uroporphyrinogen-III synthase [Brevundimonas sp. SORGH_AS_0993]MDQ1155529.1 uroporphyrinogen-III synthase [Brevundimonas sp. SORGH_AS_0993]